MKLVTEDSAPKGDILKKKAVTKIVTQLRIPRPLHAKIRMVAKKMGLSRNQLIVNAVFEYTEKEK